MLEEGSNAGANAVPQPAQKAELHLFTICWEQWHTVRPSMAMHMYMHAPQGPTLLPSTILFAPSRLPSSSRPQVAISIKYGHVRLYDDTTVKNKYRLPVGIGAVIDGEYFTRVAI